MDSGVPIGSGVIPMIVCTACRDAVQKQSSPCSFGIPTAERAGVATLGTLALTLTVLLALMSFFFFVVLLVLCFLLLTGRFVASSRLRLPLGFAFRFLFLDCCSVISFRLRLARGFYSSFLSYLSSILYITNRLSFTQVVSISTTSYKCSFCTDFSVEALFHPCQATFVFCNFQN